MIILKWCRKHKIWAYFIVAILLGMILPVDSFNFGRLVGFLLVPYLVILWLNSYKKVK